MLKKLLLTLLLLQSSQCGRFPKNVCSSFLDYTVMPISRNCWHNPDVGSTPDATVNRYGHTFESRTIFTLDGYKLGVFRIPPKNRRPDGQVIFMQHGVFETAMSWLSLGNDSLAFKLSDAGFDVWLGNFRGTIYSNEHKHFNVSNREYWDFSFFELSYYDLPAMLDLVVRETRTKKRIIYVGYSLGTTTSYVYSLVRQREARQRLAALISLAPVAYMKHTHISFNFLLLFITLIYDALTFFNVFALGISTREGQTIFYRLCLYGPTRNLCRIVALMVISLMSDLVAPEVLPLVLTHAPAATSLNIFKQFMQEILHDGKFQAFDYGHLNSKKYGSTKPPIYNVSQITIPTYLLYGKKDKIGNEQDVKELFDNLQTNKLIIPIAEDDTVEFDHLDFLYSKKIEYLYAPLFRLIHSLSNQQ